VRGGEVLEARLPLDAIGNIDSFRISSLHFTKQVQDDVFLSLDRWDGSLQINIGESATSASPLSFSPIPFPSTESLWKSTDGGTAWERILASGIKLWIDGEEVQVGVLESIRLSDSFAMDNTLFVYERGDDPEVWVSTDGGSTFTSAP
jgi:hypothetical protein